MTIRELRNKIKNYPDNYEVVICIDTAEDTSYAAFAEDVILDSDTETLMIEGYE